MPVGCKWLRTGAICEESMKYAGMGSIRVPLRKAAMKGAALGWQTSPVRSIKSN